MKKLIIVTLTCIASFTAGYSCMPGVIDFVVDVVRGEPCDNGLGRYTGAWCDAQWKSHE